MAVTFIQGNPPQYQLLSTDLTSGSFVTNGGVSYIGAIAFCTDTGNYYRVTALNTLEGISEQFSLTPDLAIGASNLTLVLANNIGSAELKNTSKVLGIYTSSSSIRAGFELPAATTGSSSGSAATAANWQNGALVEASTWNWFNVGRGVSRVIYFRSGSPADTIKLTQM